MSYSVLAEGNVSVTGEVAKEIRNRMAPVTNTVIDGLVLAFGLKGTRWHPATAGKDQKKRILVSTADPTYEDAEIYILLTSESIMGRRYMKKSKVWMVITPEEAGPSVMAAYILKALATESSNVMMFANVDICKDVLRECQAVSGLEKRLKDDDRFMSAVVSVADGVYQQLASGDLPNLKAAGNVRKLPDDITESIENGSAFGDAASGGTGSPEDRFKLGVVCDGPLAKAVPQFDSSYVIPEVATNIAGIVKMLYDAGDISAPKDFLMLGEQGSGKTTIAKMIAWLNDLPYASINCSGDMKLREFFGDIIPATDDAPGKDNEDDILHGFSEDDLLFDPGKVAQAVGAVDDSLTSIIRALVHNGGQSTKYRYVESVVLQVYEFGGVLEIQEPASIKDPSILTGLYNLLEPCSVVRTPTGRVIKRNPNCVIIITSNHERRELSDAFISRMFASYRVDLPDTSVMVKRTMARTGYKNRVYVEKMVDVINRLHDKRRDNELTGGSSGMRELENWARLCRLTEESGEVIDMAKLKELGEATVLTKVSQNDDDLEQMRADVWDTLF